MGRQLVFPYPSGSLNLVEGFKEVTIPCDTSKVSDGYHSFGELYQHRNLLFLALLSRIEGGWYSDTHHDGSSWEGYFIAGATLPSGPITYHLPMELRPFAIQVNLRMLKIAPEWDGHTSSDVLQRLSDFLLATPYKPKGED